MAATLNELGGRAAARGRSRFFLWVAVAMLAAAALGFGPSFYFRPFTERPPLAPHVVAHGLIMTSWYLLLLAQVLLVARQRVDLHRRLGIAGLLLGAFAFASGIQVNLAIAARATAEQLPQYLGFATMGIVGLLPFPLLLGLAAAYRRRPAVHKRLVFWAFVLTIGPAFAASRPLGAWLDGLVAPTLPYFPSDLFWFAALLAYDLRTLRRVHPVTWVGFLLLATYLLVVGEWLSQHATVKAWVMAWAGVGG